MGSVLIVDDEPAYVEEISCGLLRDAHDVTTAGDCRSAIRIGAALRPETLIVDWSLKDTLPGIEVARALRLVLPNLNTVLITGFDRARLSNSIEEHEQVEILEKPFSITRLREALDHAQLADKWVSALSPHSVATFEVFTKGKLVSRNALGEKLADELLGEPLESGLTIIQLLSALQVDLRLLVSQSWIVGSTPDGTTFHLRLTGVSDNGTRYLLVVPEDHRDQCSALSLDLFCSAFDHGTNSSDAIRQIMIIEEDDEERERLAAGLQAHDYICYAQSSVDEAYNVLAECLHIQMVLLGRSSTATSTGGAVTTLRNIRPSLVIVGTADHKEANPSNVLVDWCIAPTDSLAEIAQSLARMPERTIVTRGSLESIE